MAAYGALLPMGRRTQPVHLPPAALTAPATEVRRPLRLACRAARRRAGQPRQSGGAAAAASRFPKVKFARDFLLEEAVLSELVSEAKFPGNWEKYRDFYRRDL